MKRNRTELEREECPMFDMLTDDCLTVIINTLFTSSALAEDTMQKLGMPILFETHSYIYLYALKFTCKKFHRLCHNFMVLHYNSCPKIPLCHFDIAEYGPLFLNWINPVWILLRFVIRDDRALITWFIQLGTLPVDLRNETDDNSKYGLDIWQEVWEHAGYNKNIPFLEWCSKQYNSTENWYYLSLFGASKRGDYEIIAWSLDNMDEYNLECINTDYSYEDNVFLPALQKGNIQIVARLLNRVDISNTSGDIILITLTKSGTISRHYDASELAELYEKCIIFNHVPVLKMLKERLFYNIYCWSEDDEKECIREALENEKNICEEMSNYLNAILIDLL